MNIAVLAENTSFSDQFSSEHGLSIYLETKKHHILFETGQSGIFADNAEKLGIDLEQVDLVILSHGHYDHGGGIKRFFEINFKTPVYLNKNAFGQYYNAAGKYIGLDQKLAQNSRLRYTEDFCRIDDELELYTCNRLIRKFPTDSAGLTIKTDKGFQPDNFLHEQYLLIHDGNRRVVISGCSHKGILNICEWMKPDILIGGFHFMNQKLSVKGNEVLDHAVNFFLKTDTIYYTCHCTGKEQYQYMKKKMGAQLYNLASGQTIKV